MPLANGRIRIAWHREGPMVGHDRGDGASAPGRPRNSDDDPKLTRPSSGNHRGPTVVISMTGTAWDPGAQPTQMALRTCERAVRSFRERGADGACFGSRALWRAPRIDACGLGDYSTSELSRRASECRLDTFHLLSDWLKELALRNIPPISLTFSTYPSRWTRSNC